MNLMQSRRSRNAKVKSQKKRSHFVGLLDFDGIARIFLLHLSSSHERDQRAIAV
ncbi:hypothetical protein [Nostoc sp.]|uniref:hypothetical protein n=1 Tax=Nostoc sp. TaxID=1180 RepID=UPI002FF9659B